MSKFAGRPANLELVAKTPEARDIISGSQSAMPWIPVHGMPLMCEKVIESEHPYASALDLYEVIHFPGAQCIIISFDQRTSTEENLDFITL